MSVIDDINTAMAAAVAAQEAGDYKTALSKVETAWMRIVAIPDSEFENERLEWDREGIKNLMEWLRTRANSAGDGTGSRGAIFHSTEIRYKRENSAQ